MTPDMWTDRSRARRGLTLWDNYDNAGDRQNSNDERTPEMTDNERTIEDINAEIAEAIRSKRYAPAPEVPYIDREIAMLREERAEMERAQSEDQTPGHPDHDGLRAQSLDHWTCAYCDARNEAIDRANEARADAAELLAMAERDSAAAAAIGFGSDRASRLRALSMERRQDAYQWEQRAMDYDHMARIPAALRSDAVIAALDELDALERNPMTFAYYVTEATRETVRKVTGLGAVPMLGTADRFTRDDILTFRAALREATNS